MPANHLLPQQATPILVVLDARLEAHMTAQCFKSMSLALLWMLGLQLSADAGDLHTPHFVPVGNAVVGTRSTEFFVRFNRPVNHVLSSLAIIHNGKVVKVIPPRLDAAPNVLFARIETPMPGDYVLHWTLCPAGSNERYEGEFPFTVGRSATTADEHNP
jgi:hypothetical protein